MFKLFAVGFALLIIGITVTLLYFSINMRCLCPYIDKCDCNAGFFLHKVTGVSLLIAGAALLIANYAKRHSAATPKGQATNDQ